MRHADGRSVNIPMHQRRDVPPGTLRSILADAKMSTEELRDFKPNSCNAAPLFHFHSSAEASI